MECDRCGEGVIDIDRYGERLIGCVECNRWSSSRNAFVVELSIEDFGVLITSNSATYKPCNEVAR